MEFQLDRALQNNNRFGSQQNVIAVAAHTSAEVWRQRQPKRGVLPTIPPSYLGVRWDGILTTVGQDVILRGVFDGIGSNRDCRVIKAFSLPFIV